MKEHSDWVPEYKSYWLRCWQGGGRQAGGHVSWRFSLENPVTGQKRGFTALQDIVAYLDLELEHENNEASPAENSGGF